MNDYGFYRTLIFFCNIDYPSQRDYMIIIVFQWFACWLPVVEEDGQIWWQIESSDVLFAPIFKV